MDDTIIILICIGVAALVIYMIKSNKEEFGFSFDTLTQKPQSPKIAPPYCQPYCSNDLGQPIPCPVPCQYMCPSCQFDYPVPVFGPKKGAYSPNRWCPGPPVC